MSGLWGVPRSNNPNAPRISSRFYTIEKDHFVGRLIGAIVYGIVVALFFQCTAALTNPVNTTRKSVKLGLVAHATALFLFLTTRIVVNQYTVSTDYIDNRGFPGTDKVPPGPTGYNSIHFTSGPFLNVYSVIFPLSQWLADGLFLYRCYIIFSTNYWAMVIPCLLYTASIVMGAINIYYSSVNIYYPPVVVRIDTTYYSVCLSLNVLLTLMIITRLVLHKRDIRHATGTSDGTTKLYTTVIMMLVESYALYAIAFILYIISFTLDASVAAVFSQVLSGIQVIAPYLVILRVAERRALTSEMITSGSDNAGSIRFRSQGTTDGGGSLPDHDPSSSTQPNTEAPDEVGASGENGIEEVPL